MLFVSLHFETCEADERRVNGDERRAGVVCRRLAWARHGYQRPAFAVGLPHADLDV